MNMNEYERGKIILNCYLHLHNQLCYTDFSDT